MSADLIVQKYSLALFQVSEAAGKTDVVGSELDQLSKVFSQPETLSFFKSPFNLQDNKLMVAKAALEGKCSAELFNFLITLVQNDRVGFLSQISHAYQTLLRSRGGETEGILYTAGEAAETFVHEVETKLSKSLGKKVKLQAKKDPSLLSGHKVVVGGWAIDDSAQFHLNKIKDEISKRGI